MSAFASAHPGAQQEKATSSVMGGGGEGARKTKQLKNDVGNGTETQEGGGHVAEKPKPLRKTPLPVPSGPALQDTFFLRFP